MTIFRTIRPQFWTITLFALLIAALAACQGDTTSQTEPQATTGPATETDSDPTATTAPTDANQPDDEDAGAYPVTIEHKFGRTTIEQAPQRIVVLGYNEQDAYLALGVKPIAVRYWFGDEPHAVFPWAQDELGDAQPQVLDMAYGELNYEAIAALEPDLISGIYAGLTADEFETLSQIAPTVAQSSDYVDFGVPWQEATLTVGRALGQEQEAQALIDEVQARFEAMADAHPEWQGKSVVVGAPRADGQFGFVASQDARSRVFRSLGFEVPAEFDEIAGDSFFGQISMERADLLEQDLIVFHQMAWVEGGREAIESDPLLSQLDVMQEGRVIYVDGELDDALQFGTVLSLPHFLDGVEPLLEEALGGDTETSAFPVTVRHKFGETQVSEAPQRVLTVGFSEQDPVLALGVAPVAVREWFGAQPFAVWPWAQDELGDAEPEVLAMPFGELDYETIAGLQPDLIVATHSGITAEEYETLSQIAPVVAQSGDYPDFGMPWQEQTLLIGRALGLEEAAQARIAEVEAQIESTRRQNAAFDGATVAWASPAEGQSQYWAVGPTTPPMRFLSSLGFRVSDELTEVIGEADSVQISGERLDLLDADVLILQVGSEEMRAAIEADPLFQQLQAMQEGRIIFFVGLDDPVYGALSFSTVLSLPYALDQLTPQLVAAVDGDPTTEVQP